MEEHLDLACAKLRRLEDRSKETTEKKLDVMCDQLKRLEDHVKTTTDKRVDKTTTKLQQLEDQVKLSAGNRHDMTATKLRQLGNSVKITMDSQLDLMRTKLAQLEASCRRLESFSFVWKISNFETLLREDKLGCLAKPVLSGPFYTSPQGYKMIMRVHPNGKWEAKGSYLSVVIAIMKGEYDNMLNWPFRGRVTFTLIDQQDDERNRNNLSRSLGQYPTRESLTKPTSVANPSRGCPKFVSHEVLRTRRYIVGGTIFLKVEIQ